MRSAPATVLLVAAFVAGCLQAAPDELEGASVTANTPYPYDAAFEVTELWSHTLIPGPYATLPVEDVSMPSFDSTQIHMGIFRPDVPKDTLVPIIVDAGPYYADGDEPATSAETHRLGGFLIENLVPHGYAVAQVSIRGTGSSSGCVDYMGENEQADLDAVITFLGEQAWSNGAVGMIGRSYDGSTPWEAATFGNPFLKTIVPISGIHDLQQLHFRNGSAESRSVSLGTLYYSYAAGELGLGVPPSYTPEEDPRMYARLACAEAPQHAPLGVYGALTGGGHGAPGPGDDYWAARDFTGRVIENYEGSIFFVHGLQDWNVRPAQGAELYNAFDGKKKALLGQWGHNYPDRPEEHENLRWDWAEMLLRWFDAELKGVTTDTGPDVEIQDHRGHWRAEPANAWPPQDATWTSLFPSADGTLAREGAEGSATILAPFALSMMDQESPTAPRVLAFESEPFANETILSGQPRLHITVRSATPSANLWAELYEVPASGDLIQIGRAQMDIRYHAGGKTPSGYIAGNDAMALMQFYPLDARLAPGSALRLLITGEGGGNLANPGTSELTFTFGDELTSLQLPILAREFQPTRWDIDGGEVKDENA